MCGEKKWAGSRFMVVLHGNEKKMNRKPFSSQHGWLQIRTPVLPMMRKSMIWNLPNPMVSTASSTVNVFCPKYEKKI